MFATNIHDTAKEMKVNVIYWEVIGPQGQFCPMMITSLATMDCIMMALRALHDTEKTTTIPIESIAISFSTDRDIDSIRRAIRQLLRQHDWNVPVNFTD